MRSSGADFPVFVVGVPRSGTTLLYHILLLSGEFPIYRTESRILLCSGHYSRLRNESSRRRFLADFLRSRQFARSGLSVDAVADLLHADHVELADFLGSFMDAVARSQGKRRWAEKTPGHLNYLPELARAFASARFIHVVRDGRAVALSMRQLGWTPGFRGDAVRQLVWAASNWQVLVRTAERQGRAIGERFLQIRYEDLVHDLDSVLRALNRFAGVEVSQTQIEGSDFGSLGSPNTAFGSQGASGASRRWEELDDTERTAVLWAARDALRRLGYLDPGLKVEPPPLALRLHAQRSRIGVLLKNQLKVRAPRGLEFMTGSPLELDLS